MKVKHILSYACDKSCSYCINENQSHDERQIKDEAQVFRAYLKLRREGISHVMLSGGEPVLNVMFDTCLQYASTLFETVSIITAHRSSLCSYNIERFADSVLFSLHHEYLDGVKDLSVRGSVPVYASLVYETYLAIEKEFGAPERLLRDKGFSGITVRELYPHGQSIPKGTVQDLPNFSTRVYKKGNCEGEDILLLPDLSTQSQHNFVTKGS